MHTSIQIGGGITGKMAGFIADLIFAISSVKHVEISTFVGSGLVFCLFISKSFNHLPGGRSG